jgi:hypothetical protein
MKSAIAPQGRRARGRRTVARDAAPGMTEMASTRSALTGLVPRPRYPSEDRVGCARGASDRIKSGVTNLGSIGRGSREEAGRLPPLQPGTTGPSLVAPASLSALPAPCP